MIIATDVVAAHRDRAYFSIDLRASSSFPRAITKVVLSPRTTDTQKI